MFFFSAPCNWTARLDPSRMNFQVRTFILLLCRCGCITSSWWRHRLSIIIMWQIKTILEGLWSILCRTGPFPMFYSAFVWILAAVGRDEKEWLTTSLCFVVSFSINIWRFLVDLRFLIENKFLQGRSKVEKEISYASEYLENAILHTYSHFVSEAVNAYLSVDNDQ